MGEHNITNESLALSMVLVLVAIVVSYREKLGLEKDILWSIVRAVIQLIIVGYVLKYIFNVNHAVLTLLMVLFICFNAAYNAQKRSKYIDKAFLSSFIVNTSISVPLVVYCHHYRDRVNAGGTGALRLDRVYANAGDPHFRDDCGQCDGGGRVMLQQSGATLQQ